MGKDLEVDLMNYSFGEASLPVRNGKDGVQVQEKELQGADQKRTCQKASLIHVR